MTRPRKYLGIESLRHVELLAVHLPAFGRKPKPGPLLEAPLVLRDLWFEASAAKRLPRDRSPSCRQAQQRRSVQQGDPSEDKQDLFRPSGKHQDQTAREADCSAPLVHKGRTKKAHLHTDLAAAPS